MISNSKKNETAPKWHASSHSYFERFAAGLENHTRGGPLPANADQDVQYCLELQQQRLAQKDLKLTYDFQPRGHFADGGGSISWYDEKYTSRMEWRSCRLTRTILSGNRQLYHKGRNELFYQTITSANNGSCVENEPYVCPNCGAVSRIKDLQTGCPFCGTFFQMSDLFPRVSSYYFVADAGGTQAELSGEIRRCIFPWMLFFALLYSISFIISASSPLQRILMGAFGILAGVISGGIFGYIIWAVKKLGNLFMQAGRALGVLVSAAGSRRRFISMMQQHSPAFSYEYFSNKVISLLKMILYAEDPSSLPIYAGQPLNKQFSNLVDASFYGAVALRSCRIQRDYVYVTVDAYMDNLWQTGRRIRRKSEVFRMQLHRRLDRELDYQFSIRKILCPGCSGSFDASRYKICPHCARPYAVQDDDWIVTYIKKR